MRPASPELVTIRIDGLAVGGDAVGRQVGGTHDGRATFVPLAAPGETVRARLVREQARVAWAELEGAPSTPATTRVTPPCPWFGKCGGCQWQHVSLEVQRQTKRAIVARALGLDPGAVTLRAPTPGGMGYRERVRLLVGRDGAIGFRMRRSHDVVAVAACGLLSAPLARVLSALRSVTARLPAGAEVDLQAGREGVHVRLRTGSPAAVRQQRDGRQAVQLQTKVAGVAADAGDPSEPAETWLSRLRPAGVVGVIVTARGRATTAAGAAEVDVSQGAPDPLCVPAGGFSQVGQWANRALIDAACAAVGEQPGDVLELYAGSGNFTRHLCARARHVVAVDGDADAVARGRRNAPRAEWLVVPGPATPDAAASGWSELRRGARRFDLVFADPPRGGLDATALRLVAGAGRRIVYVSCDPQTLGRDARELARAGFTLRSVIALDLMPHTFHVEVVATFERGLRSDGAAG